MLARRGDEQWQAPREESQRGQRTRQALPKGVSRRTTRHLRPQPLLRRADGATLPLASSETLSERDLIRGSLDAKVRYS